MADRCMKTTETNITLNNLIDFILPVSSRHSLPDVHLRDPKLPKANTKTVCGHRTGLKTP